MALNLLAFKIVLFTAGLPTTPLSPARPLNAGLQLPCRSSNGTASARVVSVSQRPRDYLNSVEILYVETNNNLREKKKYKNQYRILRKFRGNIMFCHLNQHLSLWKIFELCHIQIKAKIGNFLDFPNLGQIKGVCFLVRTAMFLHLT